MAQYKDSFVFAQGKTTADGLVMYDPTSEVGYKVVKEQTQFAGVNIKTITMVSKKMLKCD